MENQETPDYHRRKQKRKNREQNVDTSKTNKKQIAKTLDLKLPRQ